MNKHYVIGASAVALCTALGSGGSAVAGPSAARTITVPGIADYNAALVKTAGDIVTVPDGLATYAVNAGSLEINSRFTVTLPTGFSFSSQPALTDTGTAAFTLSSGGIGAQTATFTVTGAPLTPGQSASLTSFAVQGVSVLETPLPLAAALPISMQSTNNSQILNNDPKPLSAPAFASEPGVSAIFVAAIQFIDLASPALGTAFVSSPTVDTTTTTLAAIAISAETSTVQGALSAAVLQPNGQPNMLSTKDTATVTIPGLFNGISAVYVGAGNSCAKPASAGTAAPAAITFLDVPFDVEAFLCVTSDGTSVLQENPSNAHNFNPGVDFAFRPTIEPGTSTDFLAASCPNATCEEFGGLWTYAGGGILSVTNFFTGDDGGYASLLRVNNAGSTPSTLFALVQPDTGGPVLTGSLGTIGGGEGTVFSEAQVAAAVSGLDLANSGQRATLQLIISGKSAGDVRASSFLVNPGGVVDNVGVQKVLQLQ